MTDLEKYLELERLEYIGDMETRRKSLDDRIKQIERDQARRGMLQSGATYQRLAQARAEFRRDLVLTRIALRERFGANAMQLLSDSELDKLQGELERSVQLGLQGQEEDFRRRSMAAGTSGAAEKELSRLSQNKAASEVAVIRREISKLKLQRELGMGNKPRDGGIVINISNSAISGLNLGTMVGDMNATLSTLERQGSAELAQALKALSEAIATDEVLGAERRELLENISQLGEQAKLAADQRRTGVVKAVYRYLGEAIAIGGHSAVIWATWGPQIATFFGLPH